jgi:cytochrome b subunit of formate dehydrogenase
MRRHDFDGLSFVFGLFFTVAALLLVGGVTFSDRLVAPWAGPLILIAVAIVIVIAARPRSSEAEDEAPAADATES